MIIPSLAMLPLLIWSTDRGNPRHSKQNRNTYWLPLQLLLVLWQSFPAHNAAVVDDTCLGGSPGRDDDPQKMLDSPRAALVSDGNWSYQVHEHTCKSVVNKCKSSHATLQQKGA